MPTLLFASNNRIPIIRRSFKSPYSSDLSSISACKDNNNTHWHNLLPLNLRNKINSRLDLDPTNPIGILVHYIKSFFQKLNNETSYYSLPSTPISIFDNFDNLLVPYSHPSRLPTESFYLTSDYANRYQNLLSEYNRHQIDSLSNTELFNLSGKFNHYTLLMPTHCTYYLPKLISQNIKNAIYSGQVWRRDSIDSLHYPIFHQLDGFKLFDHTINSDIISDLKITLENLIKYLFSKTEIKPLIEWREDTFPFTNPSFEMFINVNGTSIEILGCGLIKPQIIRNCLKTSDNTFNGWAFGIGLERLCMVLFGIPDIRLFWETDSRFTSQFSNCIHDDTITKYIEFSKNPAIERDISFFLPDQIDLNKFELELYSIIKSFGEGLVESIDLIDRYESLIDGINKTSHCYRITYRAFRNLTNSEVNRIHSNITNNISQSLDVELR